MTTEELKVVLRRSEHSGFGFSLLGTTGPPHVIYDIVENSPAADCGAVEAGDIILKVNGTDVHRYTTKEVLKCLRLSDDLITLELKRDPKLKARIKEQLANTKSPHYVDIESPQNIYDYHPRSSSHHRTSPPIAHTHHTTGSGGGYAYDNLTHNSNVAATSYSSTAATITAAGGAALRFKSPTHLPTTNRQTSSAASATNHSRSSSASSAKIQIVESSFVTSTTSVTSSTGAGVSTSPTCRPPSRIPTALKLPPPPPKPLPVQHSPQHKRQPQLPRPSQIPTKASLAAAAAANGNTTTAPLPAQSAPAAQHLLLQHSNSYSGSTASTRNHHQQQKERRDHEPFSAPPQPAKAPRFEAYMMTGDLILNLSRTPQSSNLIPEHAKKVDSLRDSPNRAASTTTTARANGGALAPRASGESSPTSSSSVESPTHNTTTATTSSDSVNLPHQQQQCSNQQQDKTRRGGNRHQLLQQQQRDSINNSYNNSNQQRKDSLTNDTLLLCEELERDDDGDISEDILIEAEDDEVEEDDNLEQDNNRRQRRQHHHHQQEQRYRAQQQQQRQYEHYHEEEEEETNFEQENEEDQTHYDITNIETYNSGGRRSGASDRQCLVMHYGSGDGDDDDEEDVELDEEAAAAADDEEFSSNSVAAATAKQRLRALKQKASATAAGSARYKTRAAGDAVDCGRRHGHSHHHHHHHSSSSSATVKSGGGANTSQDETSFSVPTSPISVSTPLLDKETANSVPTSPEPSSMGGGAVGGAGCAGAGGGGEPVVRRHNGCVVVRKCDSAGFRTSKSEDHLQQIQREGIAAVIPIDIDEDVNSSLNTLLDTRQDSEDSQLTKTSSASSSSSTTTTTIQLTNTAEQLSATSPGGVLSQRENFNKRRRKASNRDRIVWTYNAPLTPQQQQQLLQQQQQQQQQYSATHYGGYSSPNSHSHSHSSSISSSPQHSVGSGSPASPTSVSSSVMSSSGSKGALASSAGGGNNNGGSGGGGHHQQQQHQQQQQQTVATASAAGGATAAATTNQPQMGLLQCPLNNGGGGSGGGGSGGGGSGGGCGGGDQSVSEAISNISSPDYQDDDNLLSSRDLLGGMVLSDPSDSDSTILVSDAAGNHRQQQQLQKQQLKQQQQQLQQQQSSSSEHKLVIQVRGLDSSNSNSPRSAYSTAELKDSEDELATLTSGGDDPTTAVMLTTNAAGGNGGGSGDGSRRDSSPPVSDDGSDVESLHSYHYSPKAVDMPSAIRLAKRLYSLDGFKKSDVSRHLSKNNDFSRAVADEYLKYFSFEKKTLDQSLRDFLQQFSLSGETQERERVLVHFSKRFLDCNPGSFNSQDAVHTLTCAIMLLNTDLHGQNIGRKMTCAEFVENLAELNDGENFPKDVLKYLYQAIKTQPLEWALDDDAAELQKQRSDNNVGGGIGGAGSGSHVGQNPFLDIPESSTAVEYKKGYVMRKCCYDSNYKKTPFGKRSWKMFYCTLRDLVLFLHKDEHGFRKSQMSDNLHNAIRIHHALATKATDYTKKQHVFRLQTSDQAEYLFQTSDSKELQSWVETINFVCAAYSAPPLEGGVGSQKRFQRPLLPSTHTKLLMKEQLDAHELQVAQLDNALTEHKKGPVPSKGLPLQNHKEKESYLQYELRRYKAYVSILNAKLLADQQQIELQQLANEEETDTFPMGARLQQQPNLPQPQPQQQQQTQSNSIIAQQQQQQQSQPMTTATPQQQQSANRWFCGCFSASWWQLLFSKN